MFAKILQNNQLPYQEQKAVLKSIIQVNIKQNIPEVKLQLTHNYQQLKPILLKHWKYALRIAFALVNWQSSRDFIEGNREGVIFDLIISITQDGDIKEKGTYIVKQLPKVYSEHWKCLIALSLASQIISVRITNIEDYNWFLAGFIALSAGIVQTYLGIKNEKTQSNEDRIEKDIILVNNCETWVTNTYLTLFKNLKTPNSFLQKQCLLSALSQIIGALYQSERQGHLNVDLLHRIFSAATRYIFESYTIDEVKDIFITRLKELKYFNPIKKVEIPDQYSNKTNLQTEGVCWIINRYLEESKDIISKQKQLDYSLLIYSEILPHPFKLKETLISNIHQLLKQASYSAEFETHYPLALLLFNVFQHNRAQFENLADKLGFNVDKAIKINRLKRLLRINIENLSIEKTQFVITHLDQDSLSLKESLFLIKAVQFNFTNQELGNLVSTLFEKVSKSHGQQGRKIVSSILERERQAKRNVELCHELGKIYSK